MKGFSRVAIVGRPNVGKSTLFNRIAGRRKAIVHEAPGVTRDGQREKTDWNGVAFELVDTGGLFSGAEDSLSKKVEEKALQEALESDVLIMVADGEIGCTPADEEIAEALRRSGLPVLVAVNKSDKTSAGAGEFYGLGFETVYEVSALHGTGIGELLDDLVKLLPSRAPRPEKEELKIAVIGRPNVGKSSLINSLVGEEVHLVDERPGTTRDSLDLALRWRNRSITLVDTAGIKRRSRTKDELSKISAIKSMEAIRRADIVVLLLDAEKGIANQDVRIAGYAHDEGKGLLVCVNKWDLVEKDSKSAFRFEQAVKEEFSFARYAPVIFVSALTGQRVGRILPLIWEIKESREKRIPTGELNRFISGIVSSNPPPFHGGGNGKVYYATQTETAPPRFTLFVNRPEFFGRSYLRFLNNRIRERYSFPGTVIRVSLVGKRRG